MATRIAACARKCRFLGATFDGFLPAVETLVIRFARDEADSTLHRVSVSRAVMSLIRRRMLASYRPRWNTRRAFIEK